MRHWFEQQIGLDELFLEFYVIIIFIGIGRGLLIRVPDFFAHSFWRGKIFIANSTTKAILSVTIFVLELYKRLRIGCTTDVYA